MDVDAIVHRLTALADPKSVEGMERFGISSKAALGVRIPVLRALAKEIGKDHGLACRLWDRRLRETMILASMIADPKAATESPATNTIEIIFMQPLWKGSARASTRPHVDLRGTSAARRNSIAMRTTAHLWRRVL